MHGPENCDGDRDRSAAAVWDRTVYVGTYDGKFFAVNAATGDVRWRCDAPGAIHGAPTVMDGLVYFSTCQHCGHNGSRHVKSGPPGTYALDARTGRLVWRVRSGRYSPIVADGERVYLTGGGGGGVSGLLPVRPAPHRVCRLRHCDRTRTYATKRTTDGLNRREILRCLKRYIARQTYHALRADLEALDPI